MTEEKCDCDHDKKDLKKAKEEWEKCCPPKYWHHGNRGGMSGGGMYCLGVIGTAVYYIQQVSGFGPSIVAILKAIVWPAFLLYKFFTMLHM